MRRAALRSPVRAFDSAELRWLGLGLAIYAGIIVSGLCIAWSSQTVRALHVRIESAQHAQDALLAEYSRLLIERSTLGSYQNVDQIAERQLSMTFPETVERLPK